MDNRGYRKANNIAKPSYKYNAAQGGNTLRCAFCCAMIAKTRSLLLTLVMALSIFATSAFQIGSSAYASGTTERVATFDQLKAALDKGSVTEIVIDPQAAEDLTDNLNENDEKGEVTFSGTDVFYIPVEYPLVVSRDITIRSEVPVIIARAGKGGSGHYDSVAFKGQNPITPALFNIDAGKTLTIEEDIVMTGEEVSAVFDEGTDYIDEEEGEPQDYLAPHFEFSVKSRDGEGEDNEVWQYGSDPGQVTKGGYFIHTKGGNVVLNSGVALTALHTSDDVNDVAPVYIDGSNKAASITMDGAEIKDNDLGRDAATDDNITSAGAVLLNGDNVSADLVSGEISGNRADATGVYVPEKATLSADKEFVIDEADIYYEKTEEEAVAEEEKAAEETAVEEKVEETVVEEKATEETAAEEKAEETAEEEKAAEETAVEEKAEETAVEEKAEEKPVAVTPKKSLKMGLKSSPLRSTPNGTDGIWYVDSWSQMKAILDKDNPKNFVNTIIITKDIVATPVAGEADKSIYLRGRKPLTIKGPDSGKVHIYRDPTDADFPLFVVQNNNNELTLGENLILSGKTMTCAKSLDDFASNKLPGKAEPEEHSAGSNKAKFAAGNRNLLVKKVLNSSYLAINTGTAAEFEIDSNGKIKTKIEGTDHWAQSSGYFRDDSDDGCFEIHNSDGQKVYTVENGGTYLLYNAGVGEYAKDTNSYTDDISKALVFTATTTGGSSGTYWTVPGQTTPQYTSKTDANLVAAMKTYNQNNTVSGWIIDGKNYYTEGEATTALSAYNTKLGLPTQGCDSAQSKEWTASEFTGGNNINDAKAFFVSVKNQGTLNIEGAVMEDFTTAGDVKNAAPVVVSGEGVLNMSSGEIKNNKVGYGAKEDEVREQNDSQSTVQRLGELIRDTQPTNTAGGVIFTGTGTTGTFKGSAKISGNRADAGALIITDGASVTMKESTKTTKDGKEVCDLEFKKNVGWHHSGAVLVEDGGTFTMDDGSINNNVAWWKGGAVWATEFGTNGLVQWQKYPTTMKDGVTRHTDAEGKPRGGNFIMNGGELDSNFANARAGAVEVESDGVQLLGGTISNNKCKSLGGGIYVEGDSPIYSYTLTIRNGYIGDNTSVAAVKNDDLDKKIVNGQLLQGDDYDTYGGYHKDKDWAAWGKQHTGDGGGVWLCAMGGTSIFTSNGNDNVIIDNNHAARVSDDNNGYGDDFYISHRHGSALVQNMLGTWKKDGDNDLPIDPQVGGTLRGPLGMENKGNPETGKDYKESDVSGIKIVGNMARNGGGLAVNGTVIMGTPADVYRYQSEFDFEKKWETGLNERPVTIGLYYEFDTNNDGTIDPDTEVFPLNQEGTDTQYTVKFGTNEDVVSKPTGNELIYKYGNNKAKASVPIKIKHAGEDFYLYRVYNVQDEENETKILANSNEEFIDLENQEHLEELFDYINNRVELELRVKWNILVKEEESNEFIMTSKDVTAKASTTAGEEISLINPDNKEELDKFTVFFDKIEFGQELQNNPKPWFIKGDYLDNSTRITDAEFKLYHAKLDRRTSDNKQVYKPDMSDGKGEVENGVHYSNLDNRYYLDIDPPASGSEYYLLFETKASDGYKLPKAPWGIEYKSDGTYVAYRFNERAEEAFEAKYADKNILSDEVLNELEILCTEISVPIGTDHKINNDKVEQIKLTKIQGVIKDNAPVLSTDVKVAGAKFKLYASKKIGAYWEKYEQVGGVLTSASDGTIVLPLEVTRTKTYVNYWLEEIDPAHGYVKSERPWILDVNKNTRALETVFWPKNDVVVDGDVTKVLGGWSNVVDNKPYVFNEPVKFKKVSASNSDRTLSNVTFSIYKISNWNDNNGQDGVNLDTDDWTTWEREFKKDSTLLGTATSDANGEFNFKNLINKPGGYMIFEDSEVNGYFKAQNPWILAVRANGTYQLRHSNDASAKKDNDYWAAKTYKKCDGFVLKNERKPIELFKVDEKKDANGKPADNAAKLGGATFKVIPVTEDGTHWYHVTNHKADNDNTTVASISATSVTSADTTGKITINDLEAGDYFLFEVTPPSGFIRSTSPWILRVTDDSTGRRWIVYAAKSGNEGLINIGGGADKNTVIPAGTPASEQIIGHKWWNASWFEAIYSSDGSDSSPSEARLANEPKHLLKVDLNDIDKTSPTGLSGGVFKLYQTWEPQTGYIRLNGNGASWDLTSDANGIIELPSVVTRSNETFMLKEITPPDGYEATEKPWLVKITDGVITVEAPTASATSYTVSRKDDCWLLTDFNPVSSNSSYCNRVPNEPSEIELTKVDGNTMAKLGGAKFKLYKADYQKKQSGRWYYKVSWTWDDNKEKFTSKSEEGTGKFRLPSLQVGTYLMVETEAPEGYEISPTPWIVAVDKDNNNKYYATAYNATATNDKDVYTTKAGDTTGTEYCGDSIPNYPTVELWKIDGTVGINLSQDQNGHEEITGDQFVALENVKFDLWAANNDWEKQGSNAIKNDITSSSEEASKGKVELGALSQGKYLLYETKAKDQSYTIPSEPWRLTIDSQGKISKLEVYTGGKYVETAHKKYLRNSPVYDLPSTGGMGTYWFMIIGAMMMGFALTAGFTKMNLFKLLRR